MLNREERIEHYYDDCSVRELAEWLVDLEDDHRSLQIAVVRLAEEVEVLRESNGTA